LSADKLHKVN